MQERGLASHVSKKPKSARANGLWKRRKEFYDKSICPWFIGHRMSIENLVFMMQYPYQKHAISQEPIVNRRYQNKSPNNPQNFLIIGHFLTITLRTFFVLFFLFENDSQVFRYARSVPIYIYITVIDFPMQDPCQ